MTLEMMDQDEVIEGAETPASARAGLKTDVDVVAKVVTVTIPRLKPIVLRLHDLAPHVSDWLALQGIAYRLRTAADPHAAARALLAGTVPTRQARVRGPSEWDRAIAAALVEATKKAATPHTPETAATLVADMSAAQKRDAKLDPIVAMHFGRITGRKSFLESLI